MIKSLQINVCTIQQKQNCRRPINIFLNNYLNKKINYRKLMNISSIKKV